MAEASRPVKKLLQEYAQEMMDHRRDDDGCPKSECFEGDISTISSLAMTWKTKRER